MIDEKYFPRIVLAVMVLAVLLVLPGLFLAGGAAGGGDADYMHTIFDKSHVIDVQLTISEDNWNELLENAQEEEYVTCDAMIDGNQLATIAIRTKGNSSLSMVAQSDSDRYSFKLNFDKYIDGQNIDGLTQLALNNIIGDATYMKEFLSYEMLEEMGVKTPGYAFAKVTINGEYWGLYQALELVNDEFLTRWYGEDYGNLYKPDTSQIGGGKGGGMPSDMGDRLPADFDPADFEDFTPEEFHAEMNERMEGRGGERAGNAPADGGERPEGETGALDNSREAKEGFPGGEEGSGFRGGGGHGGAGGNGTTNLVYTDDELDSYSGIFDNVKTDHTTKSDQKRLVEIIRKLNAGKDLTEIVNVDEVLRYFAVNTFLVNLDSYASEMKHNYYLYEDDGTIEILPWDYNLSFGAYQTSDAASVINFPIDEPVTDTMENSPLIAKLLEVDEYKEKYHEYLAEIVSRFVSNDYYVARIAELDALIGDLVKDDPTAFFTYDEYREALEQLAIYYRDRGASITAQLAGEQPADGYGTLETELDLKAMGTLGVGGDQGGGQMGGHALGERPDGGGGMEQPPNASEDAPEAGERQEPPGGAPPDSE